MFLCVVGRAYCLLTGEGGVGEEPNHKTAIKPGLITHFKLSALLHLPSANFIVSFSHMAGSLKVFLEGSGVLNR